MVDRSDLFIGVTVSILTSLLGLGAYLRAWNAGEPEELEDSDGIPIEGSISERVFITVNGSRQGMFIQSRDVALPVMLFLHGGPGMPQFFLNELYPTGLENEFTVVWWEQRGSGLSYSPDTPPQSMTVAQLISDAVTVTQYLRTRFAKEKIILLGHSWGSFLGIQVAAAAPELYHAYIGMGQVSYQLRSEVEAHRYCHDQYQARGDMAMVRKLDGAPVSLAGGLSPDWLRLRDGAMHRLGVGTTRDMRSVITGVFIPVCRCRAYTVAERVNIWRGMAFSRKLLWADFIQTDLTSQIHTLNLPTYFLSGLYDYTANRDLARELFDHIKAPVKGFYTFGNSAHSPLFEEPQQVRSVLQQDVLAGENNLADK